MNGENAAAEAGAPGAVSSAGGRAARITSLVMLALVIVQLVLILKASLGGLPEVRSALEEMALPSLPLSTRIILSPVFCGAVVVLLLGAVVKEFAIRSREVKLVANGVLLLIVVLLTHLMLAGMFQPFIDLMKSLNG